MLPNVSRYIFNSVFTNCFIRENEIYCMNKYVSLEKLKDNNQIEKPPKFSTTSELHYYGMSSITSYYTMVP